MVMPIPSHVCGMLNSSRVPGRMLFDEDIPNDSTLVFETELVKLTKKHTEL
jgi:hypothetical protein